MPISPTTLTLPKAPDVSAGGANGFKTTPTVEPVIAPLRIQLSSLTPTTGLTWPSQNQLQILGVVIGGANAGRYILQWGGDIGQVFWLLASKSENFDLSKARWIVPGGEQINVVAPGAGAWDCTIWAMPINVTPPSPRVGGLGGLR